jgi:tetratricopeptide (TPR) repeat protein/transglutaminase-like putative cysteine protease
MLYALPSAAFRRRTVLAALTAVTAALLGRPLLAAAEPWDRPAFAAEPAALLRAVSALPASEESVDVILLETVYSYDDAGRQTYTQRMIYRFTDGSAHESWSALEQSWAPWHQEKPVLKARVVTSDGTEHRLDPTTVTENGESQSSPDMFEDGRVLRAPLPATGPGAIVEEEVTVRETAPFFEAGTVETASLQMSVPVRHVRLVLDAPASLPLRWVARQLPGVSPAEQVTGGRRRLTFTADDLQAYEDPEPGLPPEVPRMAYVAFSTGQSWGDLARRYSEIVDRTIRGADLSGFLRSVKTQAGSQVETINALLGKLGTEIRYTGVELAEGGLLPRPPGETLKRKFGDCKDKAVVLTTLLRALDIPAYVALLSAGEGDPDVEESLPGMGAFNHAIVMVPGNPAVWIDPTDPFARAGELPAQDQGRLALVASPTATGLVRTSEATSADNREVETREIYLSDLGGARVVETTEYWGAEEEDLRSSYAGAGNEELRNALENYVSETYLAKSLTDLDYTEPADLSQPFRLRLEAADAGRGTTDVRDAAVAVFLSTFADRLPGEITGASDEDEDETAGEPAPREHDYVFTRPFQAEVRYRIVPPAGFTPRPLPASRTRQLGPAKLDEAYATGTDGIVTATLRFDSGKRRISPAELEALRTAVEQLAQEKPVLITFDQAGEAHLAAGRVREALDEFRRLAALSPKKALPRTRIARALLAGGLGEAAREEAAQAVRIEPGFAYAWVTLGWIRQHDDLGRRFGKGYDRAGAIAAYRKAKELDPDNNEARADLAILLEHDAEGERYSAGAAGSDLAAAITEYKEIQDHLDGLGLTNNLVIAYMWAERFDDMKALLDKMDGADGRSALKLVALAATEGTDAALHNAERTFSDANSRAEALSGAGRNLMLLRRYPDAAALFEAAGRQSSNAAALLGMAELLRKARRFEELTFPPKDPASTVSRLSTLAASNAGAEKYAPLLSREMTKGLGPREMKAFWAELENGFDEARRAARTANLPLAVAMDLGLSVLRPTVSGDDAVGYRVIMTSSMADKVRTVAFVVPEDGEYRIAATEKAISTVAREALRRLDRNDLRGARQWLDWAWDEQSERAKNPDPGAAPPLLDLWTKGSEADAGQARCAAVSVMAWDDVPGETLPMLTACRETAPEGPRRAAFDRALLSAYLALRKDAEAAEMAERLQQTVPGSEYAFMSRVGALSRLRRWDDVRRAAEDRLARISGDPAAQDTLVNVALVQGDFDKAESILQGAIDSGQADADFYNELAWINLFRGRLDDRTAEQAQRAASLSGYKSYDILHTLATLYVEQGKTAEAYRLILQALDAKGGEPAYPDWYVFGRLAESYGLPDAARRCYEKARWTSGGEPDPTSTIHLVRRRLEALGAKPEPKRVASRSNPL